MFNLFTLFFIVVLFALIIILLFLLYQKLSQFQQGGSYFQSYELMARWLEQMQQRLDRNADVLERGLRETHEQVSLRLDKTSEMLGMVGQRIGELNEIGRSMRDLGDLLKSPKLRGNVGEFVLKDLLRQCLPSSHFVLQYTFSTGFVVDAVIRTDQGILCVDAKFPFANFQKMYLAEHNHLREAARKEFLRDVKKHIEVISAKYINPSEHTFDYAIMFVPSESVYYEIIAQYDDLLRYAYERRVVIVSPSLFYAYLRVILLSLEGRKVEEQARQLMRDFKGLEQEICRFGEQFHLGVKHLHNARHAFDEAGTQFHGIQSRVSRFLRIEPSSADDLP